MNLYPSKGTEGVSSSFILPKFWYSCNNAFPFSCLFVLRGCSKKLCKSPGTSSVEQIGFSCLLISFSFCSFLPTMRTISTIRNCERNSKRVIIHLDINNKKPGSDRPIKHYTYRGAFSIFSVLKNSYTKVPPFYCLDEVLKVFRSKNKWNKKSWLLNFVFKSLHIFSDVFNFSTSFQIQRERQFFKIKRNLFFYL